LRVLFLYPNRYSIAISSLAWQGVWDLFNRSDDFECHRAVWETAFPLQSIETGEPWHRYDWIAVHFSWEIDYLNFLLILEKNRIPLWSKDRNEGYPLILAGGLAVTLLPESMAPFCDGIVLGEAEGFLKQWQENKGGEYTLFNKTGQISRMSTFSNIAVGNLIPSRIRVSSDLATPLFTPLLVPDSRFDSPFLIETARGCPGRCVFCATAFTREPALFYPGNLLWETIQALVPPSTRRIGLVGAALGFHPDIKFLLERMLQNDFKAGISSFRAEKIDTELCRLIDLHEIRSITLAPETGDDSDRIALNKYIANHQFLEAVTLLSNHTHIRELRLYFIIGLGFDHEIQKIYSLTQSILKIFKGTITLSVNPFIPKKRTPWSDQPMESVKVLRKKYQQLQSIFRNLKKTTLLISSLRLSEWETALSTDPDSVLPLYETLRDKSASAKPW